MIFERIRALFRKKKRTPPSKYLSAGVYGEKIAENYLEEQGYDIRERNYRVGKSEIDLIASKDGFVAFVEVKTRTCAPNSTEWGRPADAVDQEKQWYLIRAARSYVRRCPPPCRFRFDVIEVYLDKDRSVLKIKHIQSAFDASRRRH